MFSVNLQYITKYFSMDKLHIQMNKYVHVCIVLAIKLVWEPILANPINIP